MQAIKLLSVFAAAMLLMAPKTAHAQSNGLNPKYTVVVNDLQYNVEKKKASVGSVLGTIAAAAAGQTSDNDHKDMLPAVNASVKSAFGKLYRFTPIDGYDTTPDFVLSGECTRISSTMHTRTSDRKDSKGKVHTTTYIDYSAAVSVSVTLTNQATGEVSTHNFGGTCASYEGASSETSAIQIAINDMNRNIVKYYDYLYPLMANIIERGAEKKDKAKEMYIDLGSANGLYKGQKFNVFKIGTVAGRETRTKIGKLKVEEVVGDDISLCKVKGGGKEIKQNFDAGTQLIVVSDD